VTALSSIDSVMLSESLYGAWRRYWTWPSTGGTSPTATAGGPIAMVHSQRPVTVPSVGAGILGMYLVQAIVEPANSSGNVGGILGLEYKLGSVNMNTGAFTAGVSMPVKRYAGVTAGVQTSSQLTFLAADAACTATTPTITVTYTNQNGDSGRSAALVVPTNAAVDSAYLLTPSLQAGDTGIQSVSNITKSAGTAGTISVYGFLILAAGWGASSSETIIDPSEGSLPLWLCEAADKIGYVQLGNSITTHRVSMVGVAET